MASILMYCPFNLTVFHIRVFSQEISTCLMKLLILMNCRLMTARASVLKVYIQNITLLLKHSKSTQ